MRKIRKDLIDRTGERWLTNEGYWVEIIECFGKRNCTIKFLYNSVILYNYEYKVIKTGQVKNPYHPSVYGVGYDGIGRHVSKIGSKDSKVYTVWHHMIRRCYSERSLKVSPSYRGCNVVTEWHNFQVFANWFENNYREGFELDKDILIKGNKIYSPETCRFVPQCINSVFTLSKKSRGIYPLGVNFNKKDKVFEANIRINGKPKYLGRFITYEEAFECYKFHKEQWIKELADEWKDRLEPEIYEVMYNWEILITD